MKGKILQLVGIIIYAILAIMFVYMLATQIPFKKVDLGGISNFVLITLLFQGEIILLILNYLKPGIGKTGVIILATVTRICCIVIIVWIAACVYMGGLGTLAYYIVYTEVVAKIIVGIYNTIVAMYVISKKRIIKKLVAKLKANKNVTIIAKYEKVENINTITLVYKTIDGAAIENSQQILKHNDSHYKVNIININDIKDEEKSDDIMLNSKNLYNDGRVESPHY